MPVHQASARCRTLCAAGRTARCAVLAPAAPLSVRRAGHAACGRPIEKPRITAAALGAQRQALSRGRNGRQVASKESLVLSQLSRVAQYGKSFRFCLKILLATKWLRGFLGGLVAAQKKRFFRQCSIVFRGPESFWVWRKLEY